MREGLEGGEMDPRRGWVGIRKVHVGVFEAESKAEGESELLLCLCLFCFVFRSGMWSEGVSSNMILRDECAKVTRREGSGSCNPALKAAW